MSIHFYVATDPQSLIFYNGPQADQDPEQQTCTVKRQKIIQDTVYEEGNNTCRHGDAPN